MPSRASAPAGGPGSILRSPSMGHGVWIPAFAGMTGVSAGTRGDDGSVCVMSERTGVCVCSAVTSAIVRPCKGASMSRLFPVLLLLCCCAACPAEAQAPAASVADDCLRLSAAKIDWGDRDVAGKHRKLWLETCRAGHPPHGGEPP